MAFLKDKTVNLINIHSGIISLSESIVHVFIGIYFLHAGLALWQIMLAWCAVFAVRFAFRPLALRLIHGIGLRRVIMLGSILNLPIYLILSQVGGLDWWLLVYVISYAINETLYWLPFHAYFASIGSNGDRGRQVGVREAMITAASIVGPVLGAGIITLFGYSWSFLFAGIMSVCATAPLYFAPEVEVKLYKTIKKAWQSVDRRGLLFFIGYGWLLTGAFLIWPLVVFEISDDLIVFGGIFALAAFIQLLGGLIVGHFIDAGRTRTLYRLAILAALAIPLTRAFFSVSLPAIVIIEIGVAISLGLIYPIFDTVFYNLSRKSSSPLYFQYFTEAGWDIGAIIALGTTASITYFGFDLRWGIAACSFGLPIIAYILWQYYEVEHHKLITKS